MNYLNNETTYKLIETDPITTHQNKNNNLVITLTREQYVDKTT